jgi:glyoxylase-like metal-dependent hydrolase (beta-lactamase superfamily II)
MAEMYGAPAGLDADFLMDFSEIDGMEIIETPGHSPHHLSFIVPFREGRLFFVGEAAGLRMALEPPADGPYLRPTTPPKFDGTAAQASFRKIEAALRGGDLLCYAHWGLSRNPRAMISLAKEQLDDWMSIISQMTEQSEEAIIDRLTREDPLLKGYSRLPADLRERERIFIDNSVKGIRKYLQSR